MVSLGFKPQVTLDSEKFGIISWRWASWLLNGMAKSHEAGPFYRYLQIFGVLLIGAVETLYAEDAQASESAFSAFLPTKRLLRCRKG